MAVLEAVIFLAFGDIALLSTTAAPLNKTSDFRDNDGLTKTQLEEGTSRSPLSNQVLSQSKLPAGQESTGSLQYHNNHDLRPIDGVHDNMTASTRQNEQVATGLSPNNRSDDDMTDDSDDTVPTERKVHRRKQLGFLVNFVCIAVPAGVLLFSFVVGVILIKEVIIPQYEVEKNRLEQNMMTSPFSSFALAQLAKKKNRWLFRPSKQYLQQEQQRRYQLYDRMLEEHRKKMMLEAERKKQGAGWRKQRKSIHPKVSDKDGSQSDSLVGQPSFDDALAESVSTQPTGKNSSQSTSDDPLQKTHGVIADSSIDDVVEEPKRIPVIKITGSVVRHLSEDMRPHLFKQKSMDHTVEDSHIIHIKTESTMV